MSACGWRRPLPLRRSAPCVLRWKTLRVSSAPHPVGFESRHTGSKKPATELVTGFSDSVVPPAGFEPAISTLKGWRPWPLDDGDSGKEYSRLFCRRVYRWQTGKPPQRCLSPLWWSGGRHRKSPRRACARRGLCRLMASAEGDYSPSRLLVMEAAAFLPAPIARMTVAAPVTMSPPAQMRGSVVWPVSSSATM